MKKILLLLLVHNIQGMYLSSVATKVRMPAVHNQRYALNTHVNFGKKHFIVGYDDNRKSLDAKVDNNEASSVVSPRVIKKRKSKNDSTHLLDESRYTQAFFTSMHNVRSIIAELLSRAKKVILIAAFALTDNDIAIQLKKAHDAGVSVRVVTDFANMNEPYSKIKHLVDAGIAVAHYSAALNPNPQQKGSRYARMHHKFMVIDGEVAITGSSNLTKSGQKDNIENIVVIRDKETVSHFVQEFEQLQPLCIMCKVSTASE